MKQYIICLLFIASVHTNTRTETVPAIPILTEQDHQLLRYLYRLDLGSTPVEKTENLNLDYFICALYDHIQILKYKIETKKSGWESKSFTNGLLLGVVGGICATLGSLTPYTMKRQDRHILLFCSCFMEALSLYSFYRATRYQQRLLQRLERDKRIYRQLQTEWHLRNSTLL